eukprot:354685-Chlamydomonas_euryale.AAC.1
MGGVLIASRYPLEGGDASSASLSEVFLRAADGRYISTAGAEPGGGGGGGSSLSAVAKFTELLDAALPDGGLLGGSGAAANWERLLGGLISGRLPGGEALYPIVRWEWTPTHKRV